MSSVSTSGHAKNVASLKKLIQTLTTFGVSYNPGNAALSIASLTTLSTAMDLKINAVNSAFNVWKENTNAREIGFGKLSHLSTQLLGALQSSAGVTQQTADDFYFLVKKVRGGSNGKITKADAGKTISGSGGASTSQAPPEGEVSDTTHSTSQRSFDDVLQHFSKMILLLQGETGYLPNEVSFKTTNLQLQMNNLSALHTAADTALAQLKAARIDRNSAFYKEGTGLLSTVRLVKAYVKSLYGGNSQQYKQVGEIKFYRVVSSKDAN